MMNCSTSLVIKEIQIKTTLDFILLQLEWILSRTQTIIDVGTNVGKSAHFYIAGGVANWCSHSGKQCGEPSENLEWTHFLTQFIPFLGLYPKDLKLAYYSNSATSLS